MVSDEETTSKLSINSSCYVLFMSSSLPFNYCLYYDCYEIPISMVYVVRSKSNIDYT